MDSRTRRRLIKEGRDRKFAMHLADSLSDEQSAALSAAAQRVAQDDLRRYSENFQAQQQELHERGELPRSFRC